MLLVSPSHTSSYTNSKVAGVVPVMPSLPLATIIPYVENVVVSVLDLQLFENPLLKLKNELSKVSPDFVGFTFLTPSYGFVKQAAQLVKEVNPDAVLFGGGPHVTAFPEECLRELFDLVFLGESELAVKDFFSGKRLKDIPGVGFYNNGRIIINRDFRRIQNLNDLEYPVWNVFDLKSYVSSRSCVKKNPAGRMETSRGCIFTCDFCNKNIFGYKFRMKSAERTVDEMQYMLCEGFREIDVADDGFSTDLKRAKKICDLIVKRKMDFSWQLNNGIRCDCFDKELAEKLVRAGCHNVSFGIESASQEILNACSKGLSLSTVEKAINVANDAGLHTTGFFMFGFPGETEETMENTINFAVNSKLDLAKLSLLLPIPGTKRFREWDGQGLIKSKDWSRYNTHSPDGVYNHPTLEWETIYHYYDHFYRKFYLRPSFIFSRFMKGVADGTLIDDMKAFLKTKF